MSWSVIASTSAQTSSASVTTSAINTTGASLIVVGVAAIGGGGEPVITDNQGNSYTVAIYQNSSNPAVIVYAAYVENPVDAASHTFTITSTGGGFIGAAVLAVSGGGNLDQTNHTIYPTNTTAESPGSITTTQNGELIVLINGFYQSTNDTFTCSTSPTFTQQQFLEPIGTGGALGIYLGTMVQSSAGAINPTLTKSQASTAGGDFSEILSFIPAVTAVGTITGQATAAAQSGMIGSINGAAVAKAFAGNVGSISGVATVSGTSLAAFVTTFPTSNKDPSIMMTLGFTPSQILLYDYGNSENFFVQVFNAGDPWSSGFSSGFGGGPSQYTLYAVSPFFASQWFGSANGGPPLKTVWNPFPFATSKLSKLVQP